MNHKKVLKEMLLIFKIYLDNKKFFNERYICIANMRCVARDIKKPAVEIEYLLCFPLFSSYEDDKRLYEVLANYLNVASNARKA